MLTALDDTLRHLCAKTVAHAGLPDHRFDVYGTDDPERVIMPDGGSIRPFHREQMSRASVNGRPGHGHFPLINWGPIPRYRFGT